LVLVKPLDNTPLSTNSAGAENFDPSGRVIIILVVEWNENWLLGGRRMTTGEARELRVNCGPFARIFGKLIYLPRGFLDQRALPAIVPWLRLQR